MFHLRKDPVSTVEETEILEATDTLIASCERIYRTRDAYITVMEKGKNGFKYRHLIQIKVTGKILFQV